MAEAGKIKNLAKTAASLASGAGDVKAGLSIIKALTDGSKSKIGNWDAFFMVVVALCIDITQFVFGLLDGGVITGPFFLACQFLLFTIWFKLKGVSYWSKENVVSKAVLGVLEAIPVINALSPGSTLMVVAAIVSTRIKESLGVEPAKEGSSPEVKNPKNSGQASSQNDPNIVNPKRGNLRPAQSTPVPSIANTNVVESSEREAT